MNSRNPWTLIGWLSILICLRAGAQPANRPASAPATTRPRRAVIIPPGFHTIEVNQRMLIVEAGDEAWVRQAIETLKPTTMPSTMPSDLLGQITASRAKIKQRLVTDLALSDPVLVDKFLGDTLEPMLEKYHDINPPIFYLVYAPERLKELCKAGWTDPRFYYNRIADNVETNTHLDLTADSRADDLLLPAKYEKASTETERRQQVSDGIHSAETSLAYSIAFQAMRECHDGFLAFVVNQTIEPVRGRADEEWFAVGVSEILAAHYTAMVTGILVNDLIKSMVVDDPRVPVSMATVDLMHPMVAGQLRPQAAPYYVAAYKRKSAKVINDWIARAGVEAIPKVLVEIRKAHPADGPALLKQIQQSSGIDLSVAVQAGH